MKLCIHGKYSLTVYYILLTVDNNDKYFLLIIQWLTIPFTDNTM